MKKNRIATRIKDKTGIAKSKNRNEDLLVLREQFALFSKNMKFLITTLTNNRNAMLAHSKARLEVAKAINALTVDTPLFKCAGDIPAAAVGTTDGGESSEGGGGGPMGSEVIAHQSDPRSYAAIHLQLHKKNKMYADKYEEHVVTYAKEWESILSLRVSKHLKQAEKLRVDLDHYGKKVESMNKSMNKTMSKGKAVGDAGVDKMKRNEGKLIQARREYDTFVNDLCGFIEEIMDRGWKDLHPLLVKMAQFDATLSNEECALLKGSMNGVTEVLKGMAAKYPNMKPTGRLKELETWSLESLNKVNPGTRGDGPLMIEQGGGDSARYLTSAASEASLGIHSGLGGGGNSFPDEIPLGGGGGGGTDAYGRQMSREGSFASGNGSDYDWASGGGQGLVPVPVPAGNELVSSPTPPSFRSAPNSGGLPPLNPGNRPGSFHHQDMSASAAATSGMLGSMQAAAPPPTLGQIFAGEPSAAPPPPPNMPPPPPPQAGMYHNGGGGGGGMDRRMSSPQMQPPPQQGMSQLSLYDNGNNNNNNSGGYNMAGSSSQSMRSMNTNPFDDTFGGGRHTYSSPTPPQGNNYGGGNTNPFG